MEEVAQGRVWTGKAAKERGLVDTIGGFSKAIAIAKQKAGISQETKVIDSFAAEAVVFLLACIL